MGKTGGEFRQTIFKTFKDVSELKVGQTVIYTDPKGSTNMSAWKDADDAGLELGKPYKISEIFDRGQGAGEIRLKVPGRSGKHIPLAIGMFEKPTLFESLFGRNMSPLHGWF